MNAKEIIKEASTKRRIAEEIAGGVPMGRLTQLLERAGVRFGRAPGKSIIDVATPARNMKAVGAPISAHSFKNRYLLRGTHGPSEDLWRLGTGPGKITRKGEHKVLTGPMSAPGGKRIKPRLKPRRRNPIESAEVDHLLRVLR